MAVPFIPVPNVAQFNLVFSYFGQECHNVYHLLNDSPFDQTSLAVASQVFIDWFEDNMLPLHTIDCSLVKVAARGMDTDSSPAIEVTNGLPLVGTEGAAGLPGNVTVAVKWSTALSGRSYRGRTYHIGLAEDQVTGNQIGTGTAEGMTAGYQALLTALEGTPYQLVVVSKFHNKLPRTTGIATQIQNCFVDRNVDSQRRRLAGRGI